MKTQPFLLTSLHTVMGLNTIGDRASPQNEALLSRSSKTSTVTKPSIQIGIGSFYPILQNNLFANQAIRLLLHRNNE